MVLHISKTTFFIEMYEQQNNIGQKENSVFSNYLSKQIVLKHSQKWGFLIFVTYIEKTLKSLILLFGKKHKKNCLIVI